MFGVIIIYLFNVIMLCKLYTCAFISLSCPYFAKIFTIFRKYMANWALHAWLYTCYHYLLLIVKTYATNNRVELSNISIFANHSYAFYEYSL